MEWYLKVLREYVNFSGRARRTEYWMYILISFVVSIILAIIDAILGADRLLSWLYSLAVLLPSLGVVVRRLHDIGRSGWWYLIILIPVIGAIVILVFTLLDSEPGMNKYGPNPKGY
ncbi:DUF805 domain-containing protein [Paenibacillus rhizovicinus]|uniref:DUF805 domain-containing protein n=1 Tax=Paenibacillus rhizovicinus TaxID=2704463 RepID=A0A6C0P8V0_9BACL|nr:DUF805 domain-containing protein [Paenibacillus rhizovicinus]QHW32962.1 DUF805 domain-containing protein [Paenibacillus rhizovicinus]